MSENTERLELMAAELDGNAVAWRQSAQRHRARGTDADAEACEKMAVNSEREAEWYRSLIPLVEAGERLTRPCVGCGARVSTRTDPPGGQMSNGSWVCGAKCYFAQIAAEANLPAPPKEGA